MRVIEEFRTGRERRKKRMGQHSNRTEGLNLELECRDTLEEGGGDHMSGVWLRVKSALRHLLKAVQSGGQYSGKKSCTR